MSGTYCWGSYYGWLILQTVGSLHFHLFNPVTLIKILLPPLPLYSFHDAVLSCLPTHPECVVMFLSEEYKLCIFCKPGDDKWIQQEVSDLRVQEYRSTLSSNGKIYLFLRRGLAVIHVQDNFARIQVYEIPFPSRVVMAPGCSSCKIYFLESGGEFFRVAMLYLALGSDVVQAFSVLKLNLCKMIWEKVESLGDRIFLLGSHSDSASLPSSAIGAKGNCIYFFSEGRMKLCIYDMDNGTITVTRQPCPTKFSQGQVPYWVVPSLNVHVPVKKQATEDIQVITSSNLLPELLELIFQFLHLDGIIRFRLAIKAFISANLPVRLFPPQALSNSQHLPWLISFPYNKCNICNFYHPIYTDVYTMNLPQLTGAIVRHATFGWLLVSVGRNLFFLNPFTKESIKLPEEHASPGFESISFSSPPTSSDYVVFGFKFCSHSNSTSMSVYRKLQDCWSPHSVTIPPSTFQPSNSNPVFHNGVFYCLSTDGKLGIFNPNEANEEDTWKVHTNLSVLTDSSRSFIMKCDSEIFSVFVGNTMGNPVRVYKLEESNKKMKWSRVTSLGDRVMFLSHTTSLLIHAVLKGTENRIYFPRFKKNKNIGVFYSLSSGKYHSFLDPHPRADWIDTTEHWNCSWFQAA